MDEEKFNKETLQGLNKLVHEFNANNFQTIDYNNIREGNLLKIKTGINFEDQVYIIKDKISVEISDSTSRNKFGSLFLKPFDENKNNIILLITIDKGKTFFGSAALVCDNINTRLKKIANSVSLEGTHPLKLYMDNKETKTIIDIKVIPDNILCDYFEVDDSGLVIAKL